MRRMALLAGVFVAVFWAPACRSAQAETVVTISKSQQRLAVTVDGAELYRWPVSTGRPVLATPSGTFRPIRFERKWYSRKYDWSPMPWSVFFHGGYAMHGTYETRRLGQAASHGCVRLLPENAAKLFLLLRKEGKGDTRIVVTDAALPAAHVANGAIVNRDQGAAAGPAQAGICRRRPSARRSAPARAPVSRAT